MSELPHNNPQFDPTQVNLAAEITREEIEAASATDIRAAADSEVGRLQSIQANYPTSGGEWQRVRGMIADAGRAEQYAMRYGQRADKYADFGSYLDAEIEDAMTIDNPDKLSLHINVKDWFESTAAQRAIGDVLRSKQEQPATPEPTSPAAEEIPERDTETEAARQQQAVDGARQSVEQARSVELLDDIVKLGKGHTLIHTDVHGGFKDVGDGSMGERKLVHIPQPLRENRDATDWREEPNEIAMFSDVVEQETREVSIPQETKGRFGRTHKWDHVTTEVVPGSEHPKMIPNELTGQEEAAVRFRYCFNLRTSKASRAVDDGELPGYQEFSGYRQGQTFTVSVELPKSIADQLRTQVEKDPSAARVLAEKLTLSNSDGKITDQEWFKGKETVAHPIRPPYEQLPTDWTVAVVTSQETASGHFDPTSQGPTISRVPLADSQR
jgi:hypothetical protein